MSEAAFDLCKLMQRFLAVDVIAGSVLRNQEIGIPKAIQGELERVDLAGAIHDSAEAYKAWLDRATTDILGRLKAKIPPWGTVRKAVNLFMRACICNHYLRSKYGLETIEPFAEVPLDSVVGGALKREAGRGKLPQWPGLKRLTSEKHEQFQAFAAVLAQRRGFPARVYLDNDLWLKYR